MFTERALTDELAALREEIAAASLVLDCEREFETMPEDWVYELALLTEDLHPLAHPDAWIPADAPLAARRTTGSDPAIGMPDDGSVAWTRQTTPRLVFVKPRAGALPAEFRDFLIGEALVELAEGMPETPVCFFRERYTDLQGRVESPTLSFRLASALRTGWIGLHTREIFAAWEGTYPALHAGWRDAGNRLADRVEALPRLLAADEITFPDAVELACSAIKHDLAVPAPFAALDVAPFREDGAAYGLRWVEEVLD